MRRSGGGETSCAGFGGLLVGSILASVPAAAAMRSAVRRAQCGVLTVPLACVCRACASRAHVARVSCVSTCAHVRARVLMRARVSVHSQTV